MAIRQMNGVIEYVRRALLSRDYSGLSDGQLLEDYVSRRDETALAALVHRHERMVWGVCRRLLRNHHDAEDAFQATFLVFARKAASIASRELLANWLYGVAHRTALKSRSIAATRRGREMQVTQMPEPSAVETGLWRDLPPLLDQELSRLPQKYRAVIVLCDLEQKTRIEAARQLGLPEGTVAGQLARARVMLAKRLARHGLFVSGGALAAVMSQSAASAGAPVKVLTSTIKAASLFAAGQAATGGLISANVAALTEGMLKAMLLTKFKLAAAVIVGMSVMLVLAAPGMLSYAQQDAEKPAQVPVPPKPQVNADGKKDQAGWREAFELKHEHPINIVAISADWIAAGDEGGNLFLYDATTGKNRSHRLKGGPGKGLNSSVDSLQFTPDGKYLFTVMSERKAMFRLELDPKSNKPSAGIAGRDFMYLGVSPNCEFWLELQSANKRLALRPNLFTGGNPAEYESILFEAEIAHAAISDDEKWLAVVTTDEKLRIHDRATLKETQTIDLTKQTLNAIRFSKDGKRLAVVGPNGFAKIFDPENGNVVATFKGHEGLIFCVAFSPDGKMLVTGGDDNIVRVWDAAAGTLLTTLEGHKDSVRSVSFDPSGEILFTGSVDKTLKAWQLPK